MNLIKKLNSISIDDLKSIDLESIKNRLLSQPGLIINILIISLTVIIITATFQSQAKTAKALKSGVVELKEKVKALDKFELIKKEYSEFRKNAPEALPENRLIEMLSEIALKRGVRIISFSPASKSSSNFLNLTNVEITVTSADYADLVRFINDIENSTYLIRIKKWSGVTKTPDQPSRGGYSRRLEPPIKSEDEYIETRVAIETVEFKYE